MIQYQTPQSVDSPEGCYFYHTIDLPHVGLMRGDWDLRPVVGEYTGGLNYNGKRVLDVGTATGFNTFWMENQGAEVVSFDQSEDHSLNLLPHWESSLDGIRKMKRGYWLSHRLLNSKAKVFYWNIYDIDPELGMFDVALVGSILLHLENPIGAIRGIAARAKQIVITEAFHPDMRTDDLRFRPGYPDKNDYLWWWYLPPLSMAKILDSFGFEPGAPHTFTARSPIHGPLKLYSMVGTRQ